MANPRDTPARLLSSGTISVTATATSLSDLLHTAGIAEPTAQLAFLHITVYAEDTIWWGGAGVVAADGPLCGTLIAAPVGSSVLWVAPDNLRDPTRLFLVTNVSSTSVVVGRGLA